MATMLGNFRLPLGLEVIEGENFRQHEGYEVTYLPDDVTPRYQFFVMADTNRLPATFRRLARGIPDPVRLVVEVPRDPDADPSYDVYISDKIRRSEALRAFDDNEFLICNDGMIGFGMFCDEDQEVFIDDHKALYFWGANLDLTRKELDEAGLRERKRLRSFFEIDHIHHSLLNKDRQEDYIATLRNLQESYGLHFAGGGS